MLGTAKNGVKSGQEADEVFAKMKSVNFNWRGGICTWFNFWPGNGLGVSALLIVTITVLFTLGGMTPVQLKPVGLGLNTLSRA